MTHPPFGIYIHVPFCSSRCGYCDFNTYTPRQYADQEEYLNALEHELALAAQYLDAQGSLVPADTVFIGGGTPSLIGAHGLTRIYHAIEKNFAIKKGAEVTTESNPESTNPAFFEQLCETGFNRISLGMQSASNNVLAVLERKHSPGRAITAAHEAHAAGFEHINLDMIYGTPTETREDVAATVEAMLSAPIDHISAYSLIVEDGTAMARKVRRGELQLIDEEEVAWRYEYIDGMLRHAGFDWYEVSNWAKPGGQCHHNIGYWQDGHWWGAGPGAHSYIGNKRFYNHKLPRTYAQALADNTLPIAGEEILSKEDIYFEKLMLRLRLKTGIEEATIDLAATPIIESHIATGLLKKEIRKKKTYICVTEKGRLLADGIITDIASASL